MYKASKPFPPHLTFDRGLYSNSRKQAKTVVRNIVGREVNPKYMMKFDPARVVIPYGSQGSN